MRTWTSQSIEGTQTAMDAANIILLYGNFACNVVVAKWRETSARGKASEMLNLLNKMGVTALARGTRKPSNDLSPLPLTFSEEEKQWTDGHPLKRRPPTSPGKQFRRLVAEPGQWSLLPDLLSPLARQQLTYKTLWYETKRCCKLFANNKFIGYCCAQRPLG